MLFLWFLSLFCIIHCHHPFFSTNTSSAPSNFLSANIPLQTTSLQILLYKLLFTRTPPPKPLPQAICSSPHPAKLSIHFHQRSNPYPPTHPPILTRMRSWGLQFLTCGGPSSSFRRANLAALIARPLMPSPHSFSALMGEEGGGRWRRVEEGGGGWRKVEEGDIFSSRYFHPILLHPMLYLSSLSSNPILHSTHPPLHSHPIIHFLPHLLLPLHPSPSIFHPNLHSPSHPPPSSNLTQPNSHPFPSSPIPKLLHLPLFFTPLSTSTLPLNSPTPPYSPPPLTFPLPSPILTPCIRCTCKCQPR